MKTVKITLRDALMIISALGNDNFLDINPIIKRVDDYVKGKTLTLDSELTLQFSMTELTFVYSRLALQNENTYAKTNDRLSTQLIGLAATDNEIGAFLLAKQTERDNAINGIAKNGSFYLMNLPNI